MPSRARVEINHPADGATLRSRDVLVTLTIRSFKVVDRVGGKPKAGEGHLVFYLDATPPTGQGKSALVSGARSRRVVGTSFTWKDVGEGSHRLAVQLVGSDDTPLERPAVDRITVTVEAPRSD